MMRRGVASFFAVGMSTFLGGCWGPLPPITSDVNSTTGFFGGYHLRTYQSGLQVGGVYRTASGHVTAGMDIVPICYVDTSYIQKSVRPSADPIVTKETYSWDGSFAGNLTALKIGSVKLGVDTSAVGSTSATFEGVYPYYVVIDGPNTGTDYIKSKLGSDCRKLIAQHKDAGRDVFLVTGAFKADSVNIKLTRKASATFEANTGIAGAPGGSVKPSLGDTREVNSKKVFVEVQAEML